MFYEMTHEEMMTVDADLHIEIRVKGDTRCTFSHVILYFI